MKSSCALGLMAALVLGLPAAVEAQTLQAGPEILLDDRSQGSNAHYRLEVETLAAVAPNGSFVGVWSSQRGTIHARGFSPSGAPLAPAGEIRPAPSESRPSFGTHLQVAPLAGGGAVALWENQTTFLIDGAIVARSGIETTYPLSFRLLNALGQPTGPEVVVTEGSLGAAVAAHPSGGFLLVWYEPTAGLFARCFDTRGQAAGEKLTLPLQVYPSGLAVLPDGAFALIWGDGTALSLQVFEADGAPRSTAVQVHGTDLPYHVFPSLATDATGRLLATWGSGDGGAAVSRRARFFSPAGAPLGAEIVLDLEPEGSGQGDVSLRPDGSFLAAWQTAGLEIRARVFAADGTPQGPAFLVHTRPETHHRPDVETTPGGWLAAWTGGNTGALPYARLFQLPAPACTGLCLHKGRFQAEVTWRVSPTGAEGLGIPIPLTGDTGAFWFFDPANYELVVKVLDGRGINGHYWLFYGSLTDVEFDLTVTDTVTGQQRVYHNPAGTLASHSDTQAFPQ